MITPELLRLQPFDLPVDLRDRVYNFCRRTTVENLRNMARVVGAPTSGSMNTLSTSVFAEVSKRLAAFFHCERETELYGVARAEMVRHTNNGWNIQKRRR